MTTSADPRDILKNAPMSALQIAVVVITVALNALDGFDVMSISFASPGIATEWGINRAALGIVLSMELIGMAFGSILLGGVADKIGRRPTMLGCLIVMATGMFMVTTSNGVLGSVLAPVLALFGQNVDVRLADLSGWRVVTGLGIGGMLAAINAVASEFSNEKSRHLNVSLMSIGYPIGAVLGGLVAAQLLKSGDWRPVFYFGASVTAVLIPVVFLAVPESVHWLTRKQPVGALQAVNRAMGRMGHSSVPALPTIPPDARAKSASDIFGPALLVTTALVTAAYFFHITTFYYLIKWVPKLVVDMGFAPSSAAGVLVWVNVGGATGGALFALLTQRFNLKTLTMGVLLLSTVTIIVFGYTPADLQRLSFICALAGFCINAGIVGLYAIIAQAFPTHVRASGTGFAIGVGRGGSVLAPIIAGFLFTAGFSLPSVSFAMAAGSTLAACTLLLLRLESDKPATEAAAQAAR
ncbi:MAG TPA: MFS transporter [Vicinamibacterales bacterium]|jgi:MFS transporter, AAHS family, vanillate permease|nr:MFS transporter [Vicinamibacterales bacterium]